MSATRDAMHKAATAIWHRLDAANRAYVQRASRKLGMSRTEFIIAQLEREVRRRHAEPREER